MAHYAGEAWSASEFRNYVSDVNLYFYINYMILKMFTRVVAKSPKGTLKEINS